MPEDQKQGQEKQAGEGAADAAVAVDRMRAFEVGVAHFCKDAGVGYDEFAKAAGQTSETLGPNLAEAMVEAAEEQQKQAQTPAPEQGQQAQG
jgi:hypothetical protein